MTDAPAPRRPSLSEELVRDGRTPEQIRSDDLTRQALQDRIRQKQLATRAAVALPDPGPPRRTYEQARAGLAGTDYFPNEKCTICGAILWFDGVTYQRNHNQEAHGVEQTTDNTMPVHRHRGSTESAGAVMDRVHQLQQRGVRRTGERDDDD